MLTRTTRAAKIILPLFFALALTSFRPDLGQNGNAHLEVSVRQLPDNNMKFRLTVVTPDDHLVHIMISKNDDVFYDQAIGKAPFENVFDLADLEDGNYDIVVSCGKEKITRTIHIQTDTHVDRQVTLN